MDPSHRATFYAGGVANAFKSVDGGTGTGMAVLQPTVAGRARGGALGGAPEHLPARARRSYFSPVPAAAGECRPWMLPSESLNIAQPPHGSVRGPSVTSTSRFLRSSAVL